MKTTFPIVKKLSGVYVRGQPKCICYMKEMLYAVRCLKSNEDMILALAGQFKQLSHDKYRLKRQLFKSSIVAIQTLSIRLIKPNFYFTLPPTQYHSFFRN